MNTLEIIIAVLAASVIIALVWAAANALLTPVSCGKGGNICTVLKIKGHFPEMEQTIGSVLWLQKNGILDSGIIIADCGIDEETRGMAELITRGNGKIVLCNVRELERIIAEEV